MMRFLVLFSALVLVSGCASRDEGRGGSGGPANNDGYDAPPGSGGGPGAGGPGGGEQGKDPGFPPDAHEYLTGPTLRGTVREGDELAPMKGFTVSEYGVDAPQITGEDGIFKVDLANEALPAIHVRGDGHVPTIQITSDKSRL